MADPLSIAASVAGLAAIAGKVTKIMWDFVSGIDDAPQSARSVLNTVNETKLTIEAIQHLIETIASVSSWRRTMIRLDHLALTLSNCILTLSELESVVVVANGILERINWIRAESKVARLVPRLESQKTSLALIVTVLQWYLLPSHLACAGILKSRSESHLGAVRDRVRLQSTIDEIRQQNEIMAQRLLNIEGFYCQQNQSATFFDDGSTIRPGGGTTQRLGQYGTPSNGAPVPQTPNVFQTWGRTVLGNQQGMISKLLCSLHGCTLACGRMRPTVNPCRVR